VRRIHGPRHAARWSACWLAATAAGCATAASTPDGGGGGVDADVVADADAPDARPPDAALSSGFFLDDTAADFAAGVRTGAAIEPWGAVAPLAYHTGALRRRGADMGVFTNAATATWAQVEAMTFTSAVAPAHTVTVDWGTGTPTGVGLSSGDDLTLAYDGEVYLEAGQWTFHVLADDHAFLELAPPGSAAFTRVVSADWDVEASGTFTAAAAGWHPVRLAHCERTGTAQLRVEVTGPGIATRTPLTRHRLRYPVGALAGLVMTAFDDARLTGDVGSTLDQASPAARTWNTGQPGDLGLTSADEFSIRWAGQLRLAQEGAYTFRLQTEDGQRLWIDGAQVLDAWDDAAHDATTAPLTLAAGWHDVVVDLSESTGTAQAYLGVASGPDLVGAQLPVDRLRPVEPRRERFEAGADHADRAIPDLGAVEAAVTIDAPPGAKVHGLDVTWAFDHTFPADLELTLIAPDGAATIVRDGVGGGTAANVTERVHLTGLDEVSARGTWRLRARDTVSLDTGTLREFALTVHHRAGQPPIEPVAGYESDVKDLGPAVASYASFAWQAVVEPGAALRVYVRSGDTPEALATSGWSSPLVVSDGGPPPVAARRYFQYRVELDSDGDASASLDWVRLDIREEIQ
jgi:subtilisin-like proprotein convertase family protein